MNSIRTVKKIQPTDYRTFDQQFWPIVVAVTVLCGIGMGAIIAVLRGPWLWGSLLVLPTLAAVALFLLYRLDDSKLRRSLQLAIISSLAAHLIFLVAASAVHIFQRHPRTTLQPVAQQPPRSIEISDRRASFVWEEPNRQETPEPVVEQVRETQPTTNLNPQPIIVEESTPSPQSQLVRRETPAESVPRLDESISQLRRQRETYQPSPQVNRQVELASSNPQPNSAAETKEAAKTDPSESPSENASASMAAKRSENREPAFERAKPVPSETQPDVKVTDSTPPPAPLRERQQQSAARSARSPALRIAQSPNLAQSQPKRDAVEVKREAIESEVLPQPSPTATEITRRPVPTDVISPSAVSVKETTRSSEAQVAQSAERKQTDLPIPSITSETSTRVEPRRSAINSEVAMTTAVVERPNVPTESETAESELNPRTLSVTRSTSGVAGVGRAENLESATGGATSPALRPSDSSARSEPQSQRSEQRQLTASQSPTVPRSTQAAASPTSALKVEVSTPSNVTGSSIPAERSLEAAAARIESSRSETRDQISVERGSATVDLGPTKIMPAKTESAQRSGGGQPKVAQLNPDTAPRSRTTGQLQPSLAAAATAQTTLAPSTQPSVPVASELQPNAESTTMAKSGGQRPTTLERDTALLAGAKSDAGKSDRAVETEPSQLRATSRQQVAREYSNIDNQDIPRQGNTRTEISAAPNLRGDAGLGNLNRPMGSSLAQSDTDAETPGEATTEMHRTVETNAPGNGIGKTATSDSVDSISRQSAADATAPRRSPRPGASDVGTVVQDNPSESNRRRDSKLAANQLKPNLASTNESMAATDSKANIHRGEGTDAEQLSAVQVEIGKTQMAEVDQGFALEIVALEGKPGLSKQLTDSLGMMTRPSDKESLQIQAKTDTRFRNPNFGGKPAINPDAVVANEAYRNRTSSSLMMASQPSTEAAIQLGLQFLARNQNPDGSWSLGNFDRDHPQHAAQITSDAAATGLALLAFQGAGYNHREFKYAVIVRRGIYWLIENQREDGCLYIEADKKSNEACRMYSHGIAALALTEAYGMTQDPRLKEPAQRAMDYIVATQDSVKGGWRYFDDPTNRSADTSVTGWMMMALHSGRLVGLNVGTEVFQGIDTWLEYAVDPDDPSRYRYNPFLVDSVGVSRIQGKRPTATMTSVGLLMRIYNGLDQDDATLQKGVNWLVLNHLPSDATSEQRDTYYWYYATQVLKYVDGPLWEQWDRRLRPLLIQSQIKSGEMAGSWHPYNPIPDRWGAIGGRLYVTTMNLLTLEVRHRMLPLYQKTNRTTEN